jgi:hypothetical protein
MTRRPATKIPSDQVECPTCGAGGYEGQRPDGRIMITHPHRAFGCAVFEGYIRTQHAPNCAAVRSQVRTVDGVPVYREPCSCGFRRSVDLRSLVNQEMETAAHKAINQNRAHLNRFSADENSPGKNSVTDVAGDDL